MSSLRTDNTRISSEETRTDGRKRCQRRRVKCAGAPHLPQCVRIVFDFVAEKDKSGGKREFGRNSGRARKGRVQCIDILRNKIGAFQQQDDIPRGRTGQRVAARNPSSILSKDSRMVDIESKGAQRCKRKGPWGWTSSASGRLCLRRVAMVQIASQSLHQQRTAPKRFAVTITGKKLTSQVGDGCLDARH
jgi:hypothetical protein